MQKKLGWAVSAQRFSKPGFRQQSCDGLVRAGRSTSKVLRLSGLLYLLTSVSPEEAAHEGRNCSPLLTLGTGGHANIG